MPDEGDDPEGSENDGEGKQNASNTNGRWQSSLLRCRRRTGSRPQRQGLRWPVGEGGAVRWASSAAVAATAEASAAFEHVALPLDRVSGEVRGNEAPTAERSVLVAVASFVVEDRRAQGYCAETNCRVIYGTPPAGHLVGPREVRRVDNGNVVARADVDEPLPDGWEQQCQR